MREYINDLRIGSRFFAHTDRPSDCIAHALLIVPIVKMDRSQMMYTHTRDSLLQKSRESILALPADAKEAEDWARSFSRSLVRLAPSLSHVLC
jgi:hypothetical protein